MLKLQDSHWRVLSSVLKSASSKMLREIGDNEKSVTENTPIAVIRRHFHAIYNVRKTISSYQLQLTRVFIRTITVGAVRRQKFQHF